ncbi:MAG: RecB family exonuclease, partial [Nakamurella sp.]
TRNAAMQTPLSVPSPSLCDVSAFIASGPAAAGGRGVAAGGDDIVAQPLNAAAAVQGTSVADSADPADQGGDGAAHNTSKLPLADPGESAPSTRRPLALSPSRASDFKTCPLLYRYRAVDRLPEPPSAPAVRGTLVHSVLERMFGEPAAARTPELTAAQVTPLWEQMVTDSPDLATLLPTDSLPDWLASAQNLVRSYFTLEDPRRFSPEACELAIEVEIAGSVPLRGFIDRVDLAPTGELRVVDYKTGRSPGPDFESRALYQLKFYALMIYRMRGVVPAQLKLIYLADGLSLQYAPSEAELLSFEKGVVALWAAMTRALEIGDFPASPSSMCAFCAYQEVCPAYGGTPPPYPGYPGRAPVEDLAPQQQADSVTDESRFTETAVKVPIDL